MQEWKTDNQRLESWKQIAAYLNKSERTVRRWHDLEGLPVHKHQHLQKGSVWAYSDEIDQWLKGRRVSPDLQPPSTGREPGPAKRWRWAAALAVGAVASLSAYLSTRTAEFSPESVLLTNLPGSEYGPAMSPDGQRMAFHWDDDEKVQGGIYVRDLRLGAVTPLAVSHPREAFLYSPAWSPDGSTIAFLERTPASETWLNTVPASGGKLRRIRQIASPPTIYFGNYNHLSWCRDSKSILSPMSLGPDQGIYRTSISSGASVAISTGDPLYSPVLSPDGRRLVALRHRGLPIRAEEILLHELKPDGSVASGSLSLRVGTHGSSGITWTANSRNLVLCRTEPTIVGTVDGRLFQFAAKPGAALTEIDSGHCNTVTTAPDGSLVYGMSSLPHTRLLRVSLEAPTQWRELWASSRYDTFPRFAPDGSRIAFYSTRSGKGGIWVGSSDGTGLQRLEEGAVAHSGPSWSPDGERIAFAAGYGLVVGRWRDGKVQRIELETVAQHPVWAHDGNAIYYEAQSQLWQVNPDGSGRHAIGKLPPILELHADSAGEYLYYSSPRKPFAILRMAVNGGHEELLRDGLKVPSFAIAGHRVYYLADEEIFYRQSLVDGRQEKLFPVHFPGGIKGWDTKFTVSPDERTLIWVQAAPIETDIVQRKVSR